MNIVFVPFQDTGPKSLEIILDKVGNSVPLLLLCLSFFPFFFYLFFSFFFFWSQAGVGATELILRTKCSANILFDLPTAVKHSGRFITLEQIWAANGLCS